MNSKIITTKFKFIAIFLVAGIVTAFCQAEPQKNSTNFNSKWTIDDPGQTNVFIKNYGQFDYLLEPTNNKASYVINSNEQIFFTTHGCIWKLSKSTSPAASSVSELKRGEVWETNGEVREEEERNQLPETYLITMEWEGANPNVQLIAEEEADGYYTNAKEGYRNLKAKGYRKLIYKDMYPGIDIEYIIPKKGGIKYSLIVKPGADIKKVKMHYEGVLGKLEFDQERNIIINTPAGKIIDHAPESFYAENKREVKSNFRIEGNNTVSFSLPQGYDNNTTLVIDPWTIVPNLSGGQGPYDVDYDKHGNVYIDFLVGNQFNHISKYSPAGIFLWTIDMSASLGSYYSDFCVITTGSVFIASGYSTGNPVICKISSAGNLLKTIPWSTTTLNNEGWVIEYNDCLNTFLIGGGGTQNAICLRMGLDTSLNGTITGNNFNGGTGIGNDMARMVIDDNGDMYSYFNSGNNNTAGSNNTIYKSLPPYTTFTFKQLRTSCPFDELFTIPGSTVGSSSSMTASNRLNVMCASRNYLYFFDGRNLEARSKINGAIISSIVVTAPYFCGSKAPYGNDDYKSEGIAVDECDNVYVGGQKRVHKFNFNGSTFTMLPPLAVPGKVYDIMLDKSKGLIYVTGNSFLSSLEISPCNFNFLIITPTITGQCTSNGTVSVVVSGGNAPYTYQWSNGATTNTINVPNGIYTITVTDGSCGNPLTATDTITLNGFSTQINTNCNNNQWSSTVTPTSGTSPYTYIWSNGQTTQTATGLSAGTHYVTVNDGAGCKSFQIININPISIVITSQYTCSSKTGSATASVANGNSPYTYLWNNNQNTQSISNLIAGNYTITVTDKNGCSSFQTVNINQPPSIITDTISTNNSCTTTGSAAVFVNTAASFLWSNGRTTSSIGGLLAGFYTVTVADIDGCTVTQLFDIKGVNPVLATFTQSPVNICKGKLVNFTNTGTTGSGVTHEWLISPNNVSGTTTDYSYTFLSAGTYNIKHTVSSAGCKATVTIDLTVIDCTGPTATASGSSVCSGICATVTSSSTNGTSPYTYSWNTGETTQNISPCPATTATYTVTIKDTGGNTSSSTAVVTVNPAVNVTTTSTNITCNGGTNGSAIANPGGGTPGYIYSWSNGNTTSQILNLTSQTYTVTITDAKGCTATSIAVIISPPPFTGLFTKGTANCNGCGCKEWLMVTATGGTNPYSYSWSTSGGYSNRYQNHLCPGSYTINIKDKNGCSVNVIVSTP